MPVSRIGPSVLVFRLKPMNRAQTNHALRICLAATLACAVLAIAAAPAGAVKLSQVGTFSEPTYIDNAPGKKNRKLLFVTEKAGYVDVKRGNGAPQVFLDVENLVAGSGEQGLLSMAFHPRYERNRLFYVYLTQNDGDNAVYEFKRKKKNRMRALRSSQRLVIEIPHPDNATNHNGGQIQFGPEKKPKLYIAPGDGGSTPTAAQDRGNLRGKLLRIDPVKQRTPPCKLGRCRGPYEPYRPAGAGIGAPEVYALGLRNPYRFSFDRANGALTIGDVGGGQREEVDYRAAKAIAGSNFGWPRFEGTVDTGNGPPIPGPVPPIFEYDHSAPGGQVVTGGYVIRDPRLPSLNGRYVWADFFAGEIRTFQPLATGSSGDAPLGLPVVSALASFGEGRNGEIYVVSLGGPVYRLDP